MYKRRDAEQTIEKIKASFFKQKENPLLLRILFLQAAFADQADDHFDPEDGGPFEPKHSIKEFTY